MIAHVMQQYLEAVPLITISSQQYSRLLQFFGLLEGALFIPEQKAMIAKFEG
tara:strand:- start:513 stop:668 length:156 start_codon:yes stop_codon:yes gene_type:complete